MIKDASAALGESIDLFPSALIMFRELIHDKWLSARQAAWLLSMFPVDRYRQPPEDASARDAASSGNDDRASQRIDIVVELYSRTLHYSRDEASEGVGESVNDDTSDPFLVVAAVGASASAIATSYGFGAVLALLTPRERARVVHRIGRAHLGGDAWSLPLPSIRWDCLRSFERHAARIMKMADCLSSDGSLSVQELHKFLHGTTYHEFSEWLLDSHHTNMTKFDKDQDSTLNEMELASAYKAFVEQQLREGDWEAMEWEEEHGKVWAKEEATREELRKQAELEEKERLEEEEKELRKNQDRGMFH